MYRPHSSNRPGDVFGRPAHPYTRAAAGRGAGAGPGGRAAACADPAARDPPAADGAGTGCRFRPRCPARRSSRRPCARSATRPSPRPRRHSPAAATRPRAITPTPSMLDEPLAAVFDTSKWNSPRVERHGRGRLETRAPPQPRRRGRIRAPAAGCGPCRTPARSSFARSELPLQAVHDQGRVVPQDQWLLSRTPCQEKRHREPLGISSRILQALIRLVAGLFDPERAASRRRSAIDRALQGDLDAERLHAALPPASETWPSSGATNLARSTQCRMSCRPDVRNGRLVRRPNANAVLGYGSGRRGAQLGCAV